MPTTQSISQQIWERIRAATPAGEPVLFGNESIANFISQEEIPLLIDEVAAKFETVLEAMLIDTKHDHNAKGTPRRWAKMFINELYRGRYYPAPVITEFPNVNKVDELYVVGPIVLRSACAHHMAPIMGQVWVGVLAKDTLIGLSKFHRIIEHIAARPQIQEELTTQIADALEELTAPEGIAVLVKAAHQCCSHRGVKDKDSLMTTSITRGAMRENAMTRSEFFRIVELTQ